MDDYGYDESYLDVECVALCRVLNKVEGVHTLESCCGHGKDPYRIWFYVEDECMASALRFLEDLISDANLVWCRFSAGIYHENWQIVLTDKTSPLIMFLLTSATKGTQAYEEADKITAIATRRFLALDHKKREKRLKEAGFQEPTEEEREHNLALNLLYLPKENLK